MANNVLSTLSIQLEAQQQKLDRDLDQAENKAKRSGEKMEGSLSLGGAASGLLKAFALLGGIEAGFRGITAFSELLDGDLASALDSIERMPFGIGPVVGAARDFFETVTGSREEAERLAKEWGKVAQNIKTVQSEVDKLIAAQADAGKSPIDRVNDRSGRINELTSQYTDLINTIKAFEAEEAGGLKFGSGGPEITLLGAVSPVVGIYQALKEQGPIELPGDLKEQLQSVGIEANTAAEALDILRKKSKEAFAAGNEARANDLRAIREELAARTEAIDITRQREQLQADGNPDAIKRLDALLARNKQLVEAQTELERQAIEDLYQERLKRVEDEVAARTKAEQEAMDENGRRAFEQSQRRAQQAAREREQEARAAELEAQQRNRDAAVRSQGIGAQEFLRTSFESGTIGKAQEVKDPDALEALEKINESIQELGEVSASPAVLT